MTGEALKSRFAAAAGEAGLEVYSIADGKHGPAEGFPDLLIIGPWIDVWSFVFLEFKSAREKLRPAQERFADAAYQVAGPGGIYRIVRQTPEAPGELAAHGAALCLGLIELATSLPLPGPGAVFERRLVSPNGENVADNSARVQELVAEGHGPVAARRIAEQEARDEARRGEAAR